MPLKKDWMKKDRDFIEKYIMELGGPGEKMTPEKVTVDAKFV